MTSIRYPHMREELISYLEGLSDLEYQRRVWIQKIFTGNIKYDEFGYAVHFLFDDTELAENSYATIGFILRNDVEAAAIKDLVATIEFLFSRYGPELSDAAYISTDEWQNVVASAKNALNVFQ